MGTVENENDAITALRRLSLAIVRLGQFGTGGKTLFEGNPIEDQECCEAWLELNQAQKEARALLSLVSQQ